MAGSIISINNFTLIYKVYRKQEILSMPIMVFKTNQKKN